MRTPPRLYFAPGTCARVTLVALEEIGEPYDTTLIRFAEGDHRKPEFLELNPSGKVPALVLEGCVLTQNPAILHYLARHYPAARLLPDYTSPEIEAQLLGQLMRFSGDIHPLVTRIAMPMMFSPLPEAQESVRERGKALMALQLASYEHTLSRDPWLLGESWSILDAYLGWVWGRITGVGFDPTPFPNIGGHQARYLQRPAVQRALAREQTARSQT